MLTDSQIRKAKAADKPYKLTDGAGLHLYVTPAGDRQDQSCYAVTRRRVHSGCVHRRGPLSKPIRQLIEPSCTVAGRSL
jgi:hypothetical protein